jgi:hypothetical protein
MADIVVVGDALVERNPPRLAASFRDQGQAVEI